MLTALLVTMLAILKEEHMLNKEMEDSWKKFMAVLYEVILEELKQNKVPSH